MCVDHRGPVGTRDKFARLSMTSAIPALRHTVSHPIDEARRGVRSGERAVDGGPDDRPARCGATYDDRSAEILARREPASVVGRRPSRRSERRSTAPSNGSRRLYDLRRSPPRRSGAAPKGGSRVGSTQQTGPMPRLPRLGEVRQRTRGGGAVEPSWCPFHRAGCARRSRERRRPPVRGIRGPSMMVGDTRIELVASSVSTRSGAPGEVRPMPSHAA
jgi:hypothetical protein